MAHRPSIMHRPVRANTGGNVETADAQYEREQEFWRAKSARQQDAHDRLNRSLYPRPEDKVAYQEEIRNATEEQRHVQQQDRQHAEAEQARWSRPPTALSPRPEQMPWLATTQNLTQEDEDASRRRFAGGVAEENARLVAMKAYAQQEGADQDRQRSKDDVLGERSWFNLGAANSRWVAPEHRARPLGSPAGAAAGAAPAQAAPFPWAWAPNDAGAAATVQVVRMPAKDAVFGAAKAAPLAVVTPYGAAKVPAVTPYGAAAPVKPHGAAPDATPYGTAPAVRPFGAALPKGAPFGAAWVAGASSGAAPTARPYGAAPPALPHGAAAGVPFGAAQGAAASERQYPWTWHG